MRLGSLFSGIGGIDLAFQLAGFDIAWQVENDDYCTQVLTKHWPDVPKYGDVRTVTADIGQVDVLAGGPPCQPFSVAGKRKGAADERNMWPEFRRLIGELRPRVVFLENVPAIASGYGPVVIGDLAEMGYDARWGVISAAAAGAPHRRERWWCVAVGNTNESRLERWQLSSERRREQFTRSSGMEWQKPGSQSRMGGNVTRIPDRVDAGQRWPAGRGIAQHAWEPPRTVAARSVPNRTDRIKALGNAVVVPVVYPIAVEIMKLLLD